MNRSDLMLFCDICGHPNLIVADKEQHIEDSYYLRCHHCKESTFIPREVKLYVIKTREEA